MAPNHGFIMTDASGEPVSRTYQYRKVMKPMLERKRRARINRCLDELKELMTGALQTEGENVAKLEKADILELTVRHLHNLRRHSPVNNNNQSDQNYADRFKAGFRHCAAEVTHFLNGIDHHTSVHVLKHLNMCIKQMDNVSPPPQPLHQQQQQQQQSLHQHPMKHSHSTSPPLPIAAAAAAIAQRPMYQSGIWTQKPVDPVNFNQGPIGTPTHQNFVTNSTRIVSPSFVSRYGTNEYVEIDDDFMRDDDDNSSSVTPPLSPKIEVVNDEPVWRPW